MENFLMHQGVAHDDNPPGRGSGRYEFGSGNRAHQHAWDEYNRYYKFKNMGMSDREIAAAMGYYRKDKKGNYILDENGNKIPDISSMKRDKQINTALKKRDEYDEIAYYINHTNPATGKTYTATEIGRIMGKNESSIRSAIETMKNGNFDKTLDAADTLKDALTEKKYLDVGSDISLQLGITPDRLNSTLQMLEQEGYVVHNIYINQLGASNGQQTTIRVLCPPGTTYDELVKNKFDIRTLESVDNLDTEFTLKGLEDPVRVPLDRVEVKFDEQGGTDRDGRIDIRAVRDENGNLVAADPAFSLGNAQYAQVRIATENDHYIKGMAVYNENLPEGTDILVNSNKSITKGKEGALKDLEKDANGDLTSNPFGATVIQTHYIDPKTGEEKLSPIQIVGTPTQDNSDAHVEGRWGDWSKNLPSQFLAKQSLPLAKQQLMLKTKEVESQFEEIQNMNNPVVKKKMLLDFADQCDSNAVELKASPMAGQSTHVLLPVSSLKENEIYAPNYENGTIVALVRFPHAGPFEIPVLKVNNNNKEAKSFMKNAKDAVGINSATAAQLSGADFDGDTALVIPMTRKNATTGEFDKIVSIKSQQPLAGLKDFNPTAEYGPDNPRNANKIDKNGNPTYKVPTEDQKQKLMGVASNLITDMYAKGCSDEKDLENAVKFSMVVIDAKKHKLNYQQAEKDFGIDELKKKYQTADPSQPNKHGASSLLSRSKSQTEVAARSLSYDIDEKTGEKIWRAPKNTTKADYEKVKVTAPDGYSWTDSNGKSHKSKYMKDSNGKDIYETYDGKIVKNKDGSYSYDSGSGKYKKVLVGYSERTQKSTKMYEAKDARELMSSNPSEMEKVYADYANHMKSLGNKARLASLAVQTPKKDPQAAKEYAAEVKSLQNKLTEAKKNASRERQAQLVATAWVNAAYQANPNMDADDRRKTKGVCLNAARNAVGAHKARVTFTEKEWEAVNKNAVSPSFLDELLKNADSDNYTALAMPKTDKIGSAKRSRVQALYNAGWTYEEIANATGISTSSISSIVS